MNEMNELELRLRSWAPRRPSARIERQVFAHAGVGLSATAGATAAGSNLALGAGPAGARLFPDIRLCWLASGAAVLMLLAVLFNQRCPGNSPTPPSTSGPMVALVLSNQSITTWFPTASRTRRNAPPSAIFEWTNPRPSASSISFRN